MKKIIILALVLLGISTITNAQNTILEARGKAVGTVVTVKGIVTNGGELGPIRYFQDNTAGIAAYAATTGPSLNAVKIGDSVTITGTLKNYNQLLELDPLTSVLVRSTGNPAPTPIILTPAQLTETYEARLLKINNVLFADAGGVFAQKKYQFTSLNGESGYIYVKSTQTDIVGKPIPSGMVSLTGVLSQFDYASPTAGYQLLPRTIADIQMTSSIYLTSTLANTNFTKTELDFSWVTNIAGSTEMFYGLSAETVKTNLVSGTGGATSHTISLSGVSAGQVIWAQAFSKNGSDTAFSAVMPFATISNSTGDIKVYFNTPVDVSYSIGVNAIYLPSTVDDTLINYINRAKYTIDLTMYNFNNQGISNVSNALKAAANRGVTVRVIGCGTTANMGIDELAGSLVHVLIGPASPPRTGIMHNKFILFDTESANPNDPLVWTGSTNLTDGQINLDANNVIIIQDQSLARGYKIEFEEMWGSSTSIPDAGKARFGFTKKNNTPHEYKINGKRVESYFSPTDGVNAKIVQTINTTNKDLSIATMLITRTEMADAIAARKTAGAAVNVLTDASGSNATAVNTTLSTALGTHYTFDNVSSGIMHNKYMIVDQSAPASDPIVFTGSHNWSAAADNDNDENTLIVHDATIANIYYQNFVKRFVLNNGVLLELTGPPTAVNDTAKTAIDEAVTVEVLTNDHIQSTVTLSIETPSAKHGDAYIPFSNPDVISYLPNTGYEGNDTITYKIVYNASPVLFATAKIFIKVVNTVGISENSGKSRLTVYPNPVKNGNVTVSCFLPSSDKGTLQLLDVTGKLIFERQVKLTNGENMLKYSFPGSYKGTYFLRLKTTNSIWNQKVLFE
jgi:phosphatidylserine/phosphatidylglycerophosphate/cardiolipin synthase-like enzyme